MQGQPLVSARIYDVYHLGGRQTKGTAPTREMPYCHTWKKQYTTVPFEPFKLKLANKNNIVRKNALFLQTNIIDIQPFIKV
jgi:hypothetical protein